MRTTLTSAQETLIIELRKTLLLPLNNLLFLARKFVNTQISRAELSNCLRRNGVGNLYSLRTGGVGAVRKPSGVCGPGHIRLDMKILSRVSCGKRNRYLFVAIDQATRWGFFNIYEANTVAELRRFLINLNRSFPARIDMVSTNSGEEFTDGIFTPRRRSATRDSEFERLCIEIGIKDRKSQFACPKGEGGAENSKSRSDNVPEHGGAQSPGSLARIVQLCIEAYNSDIPQSSLGGRTPLQEMDYWREKSPELFKHELSEDIGGMREVKINVKAKSNSDLFGVANAPWISYKPKIKPMLEHPRSYIWDIPYTIPQLGYLTHNHFRYYGKFPSVVAGQILDDFRPTNPREYVLDNFCGSGTTLVEAKIRGIPSCGVDVSWLGVLASNAKVDSVDFNEIWRISNIVCTAGEGGLLGGLDPDNYRDKWWNIDASRKLIRMQESLASIKDSKEKNFCITAYLAIVRRASFAYDGEVRPRVNKNKNPKDPVAAFSKKIADMLRRQDDFQLISDAECPAKCFQSDSKSIDRRKLPKGDCYLIISHPPYLNSFDYSPVYRQEYYWSKLFRHENDDVDRRSEELKAWPANQKIVKEYYSDLEKCYVEACDILKPGGGLAVVIGDCTIQGKLEPVLSNVIEIIEGIGFNLVRVNYRTTHYGLGKYAYQDRADYHGTAKKRDAVIYFEKK